MGQNLKFQISILNPYFIVVFLERLQSFSPLPSHLIIHLGDVYKFKNTFNAELRFRYYGVALSDPSSTAAKTLVIDAAKWLIGEDETGVVKGRMKFCRTVFRGVWRVDKDLAVRSWEKAKKNFHPIARKLIEKVSIVGLGRTWTLITVPGHWDHEVA